MAFLHFCIVCARAGRKVFGPRGARPWPEVQDHAICAGGRVWACTEHWAEVAARSEECRPDRLRPSEVQPQSRGDRPVSGENRDAAGGAGQLSLI